MFVNVFNEMRFAGDSVINVETIKNNGVAWGKLISQSSQVLFHNNRTLLVHHF